MSAANVDLRGPGYTSTTKRDGFAILLDDDDDQKTLAMFLLSEFVALKAWEKAKAKTTIYLRDGREFVVELPAGEVRHQIASAVKAMNEGRRQS